MNAQDCQVDILQLQFLQKGMNPNELTPISILGKWTSWSLFLEDLVNVLKHISCIILN